VRDRHAAVALGRDDRLDAGCGKFGADGIGVIALVREQCSMRSPSIRNSGPKPCTSCA